MAQSALAEALGALGDNEAASAALEAGQQAPAGGTSSAVGGALDEATQSLRTNFDRAHLPARAAHHRRGRQSSAASA